MGGSSAFRKRGVYRRGKSKKLMRKCIDEAKKLLEEMGFREYQSDILGIALALFRKQSSHIVYWKDNRCKEKFDRKTKK
ncbi:hypothetical protein ACFL6I_28205 [candidate division KSB1 bacterium]